MWQRILHGNRSQLIVAISLIVILLVIPATILLTRQSQENRTRATASTTLTFTPASTTSSPLQKNINDVIPLTITIDPGTNLVSVVKLDIAYDPTAFLVTTSSFAPNTNAFPTTLTAPVVSGGHFTTTISIGSDTTKAIQTATTLGTFTLTAIAPTNASSVTFASGTAVYSLAFQDQAAENVLASSVPEVITVVGPPTPTPTPTNSPTPTALPTLTATPTPTATNTPTPTNSPTPTPLPTVTLTPTPTTIPTTKLALNLFLHGIGNSGDNVNPTGSATSNKNPRSTRSFTIFVFDTSDVLANQTIGTLQYNSTSGSYQGTVDLGANLSGRYSIKVKTQSFLRRLVATTTLSSGATSTQPAATLVAGDVISDNAVNILDYNVFVDCAGGTAADLPISDPGSQYNSPECASHPERVNADLNDDGFVNSVDLTLFLRELSVQNGQ